MGISEICQRVVSLFRRTRLDEELAEEMRLHIDLRAARLREQGLDPNDAARVARKGFGNATALRETSRDLWGWRWIEEALQDLRYGTRMLAARPGLAAIVILTLALGIGANTAMFSILHAVMLKPLPYKDAARLVAVFAVPAGQSQNTKVFASFRAFQDWQRHSQSFEQLEALSWAQASGRALLWRGTAHPVLAIPATLGFFSLLGVQAARGRTFEDSDRNAGCTTVLSDGFWKNRLGSSPDIVGGSVTLDGQACTVIGIMPAGFEFFPKPAEVWTLITPQSAFERQPLNTSIGVFGRLRPNMSRASAQAELAAIHQQVVRDAPPESGWGRFVPAVYELQEEFTWLAGRNLRSGLVALFGAVLCVVLIACVNVASLQLARGSERGRELAIRTALGSGRSRLVRQLVTETMILALLGAVLGTALAVAGVKWFRSANPVQLPPGNAVAVDWQVLLFTAGLTIVAGFLSGLAPAARASRIDLNEALKETTRGGTSGALARRATKAFIVTEVALSLMLLSAAGLLIQSIARLSSVPLGFRTENLVTTRLNLPDSSYPGLPQRTAFYNSLISRLATLPGVEAVAMSSTGGWHLPLTIPGRPAPSQTELSDITMEQVSADYLATMGIPLVRGRPFNKGDREGSQPVTIVNEALARKYFPNQDPLGLEIKLGGSSTAGWLTIVGIAGNVKGITLFNEMAYEASPIAYRPLNQSAGGGAQIVLRTKGKITGLTSGVQAEVSALDRGIPIHDVKTMDQQISESLAHPRFRAILGGSFAGLALLLAAIGIYGVLSESVSGRTREIGVRMALGAERREVLRLVIGQGLAMTLAGAVIGVAAALSVTRFLTSMLFDIKPADPVTFVAVLLMLAIVVVFASYVPARRATKVDPMVALRNE